MRIYGALVAPHSSDRHQLGLLAELARQESAVAVVEAVDHAGFPARAAAAHAAAASHRKVRVGIDCLDGCQPGQRIGESPGERFLE